MAISQGLDALRIARAIIEETHQGKISVSSEVGKGTEFTIEIPIEPKN